jgi:UDP-N-acetylglucosamine 1-carboxyvinyltransferase
MRAVLFKLEESGVELRETPAGLRLTGRASAPIQVRTLAYPGFPTDMQAPMMALALRLRGTSVFLETIFENRFMHAREMARLGANIRIEDRIALVSGGGVLAGTTVSSTDLRGGAAMMLAGLAAEGETILRDPAGHIARGYEDLPGMLNSLGADITVEGEERLRM